jgi:hypothetical protein
MAIRFRTPPNRSRQALRTASNSLRPAANPRLRTMGRVFPVEHTTDEPVEQAFPVYQLGLDDIVEPQRGLRGARLTSWQYLIDDELSASVLVDNERNQHRFASFTRGRLSAALAQRVAGLNGNWRLLGRNIELSLLEIPALRVTALWLRDDDPDFANDFLLPVLSDQTSVAEGKLLTVRDFIRALVEPARILLASSGDA